MQTAGLLRITVAAPRRRIDMALPEHALVAELLPGLLARAGEGLADEGASGGGWQLRRADGTAFDLNRTLRAYRVGDGEILHLTPGDLDWPEPEYDDLVDAIATGAGRTGGSWGPRHTRRAGLAAGALLALLGLFAVLRAGPPWGTPALWAFLAALALLAAGAVLARAVGDAAAGAVPAGVALPYAAVGGALALADGHSLAELSAGQVVLAGAALLVASVIGLLGATAAQPFFVAAGTAGVSAVLGGSLASAADLTGAQAAAVVAGGLLLLSIAFAPMALRFGKVPMPVLPRSTADLVRDDPQPPVAKVHAAVARADGLLTGMLCGAAAAVLWCELSLAAAGQPSSVVLLSVLSAGLLLRARLYPVARQRIPLLAAGLFGAACLAAGPAAALPGASVLAILFALAAVVLAAGVLLSTRAANPYLGRAGEYCEILVVAAVVPLVCWVLGLYAYARGLGG
ncbi:type VII secretion integral membrane protein EccD [Amycolatopsis sp. NPDC003676]